MVNFTNLTGGEDARLTGKPAHELGDDGSNPQPRLRDGQYQRLATDRRTADPQHVGPAMAGGDAVIDLKR